MGVHYVQPGQTIGVPMQISLTEFDPLGFTTGLGGQDESESPEFSHLKVSCTEDGIGAQSSYNAGVGVGSDGNKENFGWVQFNIVATPL